MSDRVSQTILLCEDEAQERLTKAFLKQCRLPYLPPQVESRVASRAQQGGNAWVLSQFPKELHACRQRQTRAKTLLIVLLDADNHSVEERQRQLANRLVSAEVDKLTENDPVVLLIPKRNIETWIRALLGETVTEEEDCKPWNKIEKDVLRRAAETLFEWTRPNATPGATCVASLLASLPMWQRIG